MAMTDPLERYRIYLEVLDAEAQRTAPEEYIDLLTPGEVIDLLITRDRLADRALTTEQRRELGRLDDLLLKYQQIIVDNIRPYPDEPRAHWWWHLHEGPQVREQAASAA